jgi:predicted nucleic acid-binding protein
MPYLFDSNILLRLVHRQDAQHELVRTAVRALRQRGERGYYTSQNLGEFWNVCTRPITARSGWGRSIAATDQLARTVERIVTLLPDTPAIHTEWRRLLVTHAVEGAKVHDARLVAAMKVHGLTHILTLDKGDFHRYEGITVVHPQNI